jgi:hypothetical protein
MISTANLDFSGVDNYSADKSSDKHPPSAIMPVKRSSDRTHTVDIITRDHFYHAMNMLC